MSKANTANRIMKTTKATKTDLDSVLNEMSSYIENEVAAGFSSKKQIWHDAIELFEDAYVNAVFIPMAKLLTVEAITKHRREQTLWPIQTDCDLLFNAFKELNSAGIVTAQYYWSCAEHSAESIWEEIDQLRWQGLNVRGYAYFDMNSAASVVNGNGLNLNWAIQLTLVVFWCLRVLFRSVLLVQSDVSGQLGL